MTALLAVVACLGAVAFALWNYGWREPPVRGRWTLAGLRAAALVLLVLLLWNPRVSLGDRAASGAAPGVLLDVSLSMAAVGEEGVSSWEAAVSRARELAGEDGRVLLFGESVRPVPVDSLASLISDDRETRLAPAVERAAELGAGSVHVLTDRRIQDPAELARVVARTGTGLRFEEVPGPVRNAGIGELIAPPRVSAGDTVAVEAVLHGLGREEGDSVDLVLSLEGAPDVVRRVPLPAGGRPVRHRIRAPVGSEGGVRRLEVSAGISRDAFPRDDQRATYLEVGAGAGRLLLLSLDPGWEPRYLLPVLEQVTGLEARGFLRVGEGRWLPMGRREERGGLRPESEIRSLVAGTEVLALHGAGSATPAWIREAIESIPRVVVLPTGPAGAALAGIRVVGPLGGEWYAVPRIPSSPLAGELSGLRLEGLPPLSGLLPVPEAAPGAAPLLVQRAGSGPVEAALVLREEGGARTAVTLASGFWRWGARDGPPRDAYRRLWGAVAGWLLEARREGGAVAVEPRSTVQPQGRPVAWRARGLERDDSVRLEVDARAGAGEPVLDTVVALPGEGGFETALLPPGIYRYRATAPGGGPQGEGLLEVTAYSDELLRAAYDASDLEGRVTPGGEEEADGAGRPLRTRAAPYLLLLGLLSAEWIGRRRTGLR